MAKKISHLGKHKGGKKHKGGGKKHTMVKA